jgi:hypothetical protein
MDKPNMVGKRFGRLVVLEETVSKHNRSRWVCRCDCGKSCISTGKTLREGKKSSCGCLRREVSQAKVAKLHVDNTLPVGEASCNQLYSVYRWQAEKRRFEFSLTKDDFRRLTKGNCFYCGIEPLQTHHQITCKTPYIYNGIDRQDNNVGYTVSNCVSCCGVCNDMKRTRTVEDFVKKCEAVAIHQNYKRLAEMSSPLLDEGQQ